MAFYTVDKETGDITLSAGGTLYADAPVGTIFEYGGTTAPSGYGLCNHQAVSRTEYAELFSRIGTTYGSGDGSTTFNLPDKTQLEQDCTVKTQVDTWTSNLENGSESHTFTVSADGSYYFEIVLSNASSGKQSNNISLTTNDNKLVSTWGYIGVGATLLNKTVFLKAGTYAITHICQTAGIGGTSVVTVYSTRNEPVGSYIIKMKQTPVPADFMDAVDEAVSDATSTTNTLINSLFNPLTSSAGNGVRKFLNIGTGGGWTHTAKVTGCYQFLFSKHNHGNTVFVNVNNVTRCSYPFWGSTSDGVTTLDQGDISWTPTIYVNKGDIITVTSDNNSTDGTSRWFLNSYNYWGIG